MVSGFACEFRVSVDLVENWIKPFALLGASVDTRAKPDAHIDTTAWTKEKWHIWNLGGVVAIDDEHYGVVSFYLQDSGVVHVTAIASWRVLLTFLASGAYGFYPRFRLRRRLRCNTLFLVSCVVDDLFENILPTCGPVHRSWRWPNGDARCPAVARTTFPAIEFSIGARALSVVSGPAWDGKRGAVAHYVSVFDSSTMTTWRTRRLKAMISEELLKWSSGTGLSP